MCSHTMLSDFHDRLGAASVSVGAKTNTRGRAVPKRLSVRNALHRGDSYWGGHHGRGVPRARLGGKRAGRAGSVARFSDQRHDSTCALNKPRDYDDCCDGFRDGHGKHRDADTGNWGEHLDPVWGAGSDPSGDHRRLREAGHPVLA